MKNKFHNVKCECDGHRFDSKREMERYNMLKSDPSVTGLALQVPFELIPKCGSQRAIKYVADFTYLKDGEEVIEDVKGVETDVFKLKKKLFYWRYGKEITIWK